MQKFVKWIAVAFLSLTVFSGLVVTANSVSAQENVSISLWHSLSGAQGEALEQMVSDFNSTVGAEKGIVAEAVYQGNDVMEQINTLSISEDTKNFPEIGLIYGSSIPIVKDVAQTKPIEDFYEEGENIQTPKEDLEPNTVRAFSYDNRLIGMPYNPSSILLYYNVDMFNEVGLDPNNPPITIDELAQATEALTIKDGDNVSRYGLNVQVQRYQLANWINGQGEYSYFGNDEDGRSGRMTEVTMGTDGTLDKFLTEYQKLLDTGGLKYIDDAMNEEFAAGLFGMAIMSSGRISTIESLTEGNFEFKVSNLPKVSAEDTGGTAIGGGSLVIFDKGDQAKLDAAWELVQFSASPEQSAKYHMATGYLPVNKKALETEELIAFHEENPLMKVAIDQMHESHENVQEPFEIIWKEFNDVISSQMVNFSEGGQTKEETIENMTNELNSRLNDYNSANPIE